MNKHKDFFDDAYEFYLSRRRKLKNRLKIEHDHQVEEFCVVNVNENSIYEFRRLSYENICKLCMLFSGVLGERLPDHIHNRMILGPVNSWVKEYIENLERIKPPIFGLFNINKNQYPYRTLGDEGHIRRYILK